MSINLEMWKKIVNKPDNDFGEGVNYFTVEDVDLVTINDKPLLKIITDKGNIYLNLRFKGYIERINSIVNGFKDNPNVIIGKKFKMEFNYNQQYGKITADWKTLQLIENEAPVNNNDVPF